MQLVEMTCPSCGADLKLDADNVRAVCEYCGSEVLVDVAGRRDAEQEGYEFEKGRQRAMAEYAPPRKRSTWLWVLGWIFIFPGPVTILALRSKLKSWQKAAIIILVWAAYLAIGLYGDKKEQDKSAAGAAGASVSSSVSASQPAG